MTDPTYAGKGRSDGWENNKVDSSKRRSREVTEEAVAAAQVRDCGGLTRSDSGDFGEKEKDDSRLTLEI